MRRIPTRFCQAVGAALLVLIPMLLLRAGQQHEDIATVSRRWPSPANNVRSAQPRGLLQQELLGINPERLILYAPMPADTGDISIPRN